MKRALHENDLLSQTPEKKTKIFSELDNENDLYCNESLPPLCHCVICFLYMGDCNPRQYCQKTYCNFMDVDEDILNQERLSNLEWRLEELEDIILNLTIPNKEYNKLKKEIQSCIIKIKNNNN